MPRVPRIATGFPPGCQVCEYDGPQFASDPDSLCPQCREMAERLVLWAAGFDIIPERGVTFEVLFADLARDQMTRLAEVVEYTARRRHGRSSLADARCLADRDPRRP